MICFMCSLVEGVEEDDLVDAVQELRAGNASRSACPGPAMFDVMMHDGVLEVHRPALAVGQPAIVQQLQHDVQHLGVRLFDLVEQHDG